jgi:hypothetical protein
MLRNQDYKNEVVISSEGIATLTLPAAGTVITKDNLPQGAIVVVDAGNRRLDNAAFVALGNNDYFRIAQGLGTSKPLFLSAKIRKGGYSTTIKSHVAATEQITTIGSNGTDGSLPSANETGYFIKIRKNDNDAANRSQPTDIFAQFTSSASTSQSEIAFGLINNLNKNLALEPANGYLVGEVNIDTAATNTEFGGLLNPTGNVTLTKGSKIATMTDTQDLSAGDYFRVDSSATETLTAPVYRIKSVDSATQVTLDSAFTGTTAAIDDDFIHLIPSATGIADNFGIRLTGVEADFDVAAFRDFYKNRFTASFSDSTVSVRHVQGASEGVGSWQRVQMDEYFAQWGFEGQDQMAGVPPRPREQEASANSKYSVCTLSFTDQLTDMMVTSSTKGSVAIYLELDSSSPAELTNANTGFEAVVTVLAAGGATDFDE